jgi:hypothetical protein
VVAGARERGVNEHGTTDLIAQPFCHCRYVQAGVAVRNENDRVRQQPTE